MCALVGRNRVEQVALLSANVVPKAGSEIPVFLLHIEHDHGLGPAQQIGDHDPDTLAAARRRSEQHELLTTELQVAPIGLAKDDPPRTLGKRLVDLSTVRKSGASVELSRLAHGPPDQAGSTRTRAQFDALVLGLPWQRLAGGGVITVV